MPKAGFVQGPRFSDDVGPSWRDCRDAATFIWDHFGYRVDIRLVQPVRRLDGKGDSGWTVVTRLEPREGRPGREFTTTACYGQGGLWKTAPAALHAALRDAQNHLEAWE